MSSLFSGPTTTTSNTSSQQQQSQGSNTQQGSTSQQGSNTQTGSTSGQFNQSSTPNLPAWYSTFLSQIPGQYQQLAQTFSQNAATPLYGQQQQANFQNQLAGSQRASNQTLQSQLASQGALNSGRAAQMDTQQSLGGQSQLANYLAQVPQLNAQYKTQQLQGLQGAVNGAAGFTSPINAFGTTTSGSNQTQSLQDLLSSLLGNTSQSGQQSSSGSGSSNSNQTQQQSGGLMSSLLNAGLGYLTGGLSGVLGQYANGMTSGQQMAPVQAATTDYYQNLLNNPVQPSGGYMGGGLY